MSFSNSEYYEMILCVGASGGSLREARRLYSERFIDGRAVEERRRLPSLECFRKMVLRLQQSGSFHGFRREGRPSTVDPDIEESILDHFDTNPRTSTRRAAAALGINHVQVWRVLRDDGQHPYHFRRTQELTAADFPLRVRFCEWYRDQVAALPNFGAQVLWTDEASFTRDGISNVHNEHVWSHQNPQASAEASFQHQWRINVWAGIIGEVIIGPVFLPNNLNSENYLSFLMNTLEEELENFPVATYVSMLFQHDGAPAHFARSVRAYLDTRYEQWIGRGGPIAWPPRSPDLTVLDFFLWGYVKGVVYSDPCDTCEEMQSRIIDAFTTITPQMLRNVQMSMYRRVNLCIEQGGRHFEPLL